MNDDLRAAKGDYDAAIDRLLDEVASDDIARVNSLCIEVLAKVGPLKKAIVNAAKHEGFEKAEALRQTASELTVKTHFFVTTILSYRERRHS